MTDQELRDLVAENSRALAQMREQMQEQMREKAEQRRIEAEQRSFEAEQRSFEAERRQAEFEKNRKDSEKSFRDLNKYLNKVSREIGYIGNTFGRFTEGLFLPSLENILLKDFGLDTVAPRIQRRQNGSFVELDVLAFSNSGKNTAVVVEIKSKLRDDDIRAFLGQLANFPQLFPEHKEKKLYGMIAAVGISAEQKSKMERLGIYVVQITGDVFKIISSKNFQPRDFGLKE